MNSLDKYYWFPHQALASNICSNAHEFPTGIIASLVFSCYGLDTNEIWNVGNPEDRLLYGQ
jgi:hypothetical protein